METVKRRRKLFLEGPIVRALVTLAIPIVLGNVLQAGYQLTDAFWVGRLVLLCHIFLRGDGPVIGALQHGHRGRLLTSAPISRRRMVAIEFGM